MTKYVVTARIEVELPGEEEYDEALKIVDNTLQRAWDTDRGRHHVHPWHFEIQPDEVVELEAEEQNVTDVPADTGGLA